ncbi:hypothetical protein DIPPA_51444 [Diplonema papillatum]|nr:hypothetical protein DIPPA_51444 [Diplonema papillatum]
MNSVVVNSLLRFLGLFDPEESASATVRKTSLLGMLSVIVVACPISFWIDDAAKARYIYILAGAIGLVFLVTLLVTRRASSALISCFLVSFTLVAVVSDWVLAALAEYRSWPCLSLLSCITQSDSMVSMVLFDAHRRTVLDRDNLLEGLRPMKEGLIGELGGTEINFSTINGDTLNGIHFKGTEPKAVIFLQGNGCFYETSGYKPLSCRDSFVREGTTLPHFILFNPRGTGESTGRTQTNYVIEDFILIFDYLVNECDVNPSHVVIGGHSMGGYFSLFGAAAIQKRYPEAKINFVSDRSIWDLKSRVSTKVEGAGYHGLKAALLSSYISSVISSPDWSRDSREALESLKGRVLVIYHPKDGVVLYDDSTHKGLLAAHRVKEYFCLELSEEDPHAEVGPRPHNREFSDMENQKIVAELRRMLEIPPSSEDRPLDVLNP